MENENEKKNIVVRVLHRVFVHNWGLKITAILTACVLWLLAAGL